MKVKELIKILQEVNPEWNVYAPISDYESLVEEAKVEVRYAKDSPIIVICNKYNDV